MRLTGSRFHLAVLCAYPFREDVKVEDKTTSAAAALGSEAHAYVEAKYNGLDMPALFFSPDATRIGEQVWSWILTQPRPTAVEIKLVYDAATDTARQVDEAAYPGARNYGPTKPSEIPVTLDMLWVDVCEGHADCLASPRLGAACRGASLVVVRDLKTGQKAYAHREQLVIQALAASRFYGVPKAEISFVWGRKTKCDADPLELLDEGALQAASWEVAATLTGIPIAQPRRGDHCYFCSARKQGCPVWAEPTEDEREAARTA